jgi:hypothetical protein
VCDIITEPSLLAFLPTAIKVQAKAGVIIAVNSNRVAVSRIVFFIFIVI